MNADQSTSEICVKCQTALQVFRDKFRALCLLATQNTEPLHYSWILYSKAINQTPYSKAVSENKLTNFVFKREDFRPEIQTD